HERSSRHGRRLSVGPDRRRSRRAPCPPDAGSEGGPEVSGIDREGLDQMLGAPSFAFSAKGGMTQIGKSQDLPRMNADQHGSERRAKTQLPAKAAGLDKKLRSRSQRPGASSLEANSLLYRCHAGAEAGLVAGAGVLVDHALSHSLVDQGDGVAEGRPG